MSSSNCLRPHLLGFFSAPAAIVRLWPAHRDAPVNPTLFPATPGVAADLCWFAQTTWSTLSLSSRPYSGYQFRFLLSSGDLSLRSPITFSYSLTWFCPRHVGPPAAAHCHRTSKKRGVVVVTRGPYVKSQMQSDVWNWCCPDLPKVDYWGKAALYFSCGKPVPAYNSRNKQERQCALSHVKDWQCWGEASVSRGEDLWRSRL